LTERRDRWIVHCADGRSFDAPVVLLNLPPEQARGLAPALVLQAPVMHPTWAVMAELEEAPCDFDAAFVNQGALAWIASQASKPARQGGHRWVLHATSAWSIEMLECPPAEIAQRLVDAFFGLPGLRRVAVKWSAAHRWRFARSAEPLTSGYLGAVDDGAMVVGDWCSGDRVQGAWRSGRAAAEAVLESRAAARRAP